MEHFGNCITTRPNYALRRSRSGRPTAERCLRTATSCKRCVPWKIELRFGCTAQRMLPGR
jgi:hypothetical protein